MTYTTNNTSETICKHRGINPDYPQLVSTFLANLGASIIKDNYIARTYGFVKPKMFSHKSIFMFFFRDISTISLAFIIPKYIS
jgi:hypothetical protein